MLEATPEFFALMSLSLVRISVLLVLCYVLACVVTGCMQRRLLYFPTHYPSVPEDSVFQPWERDGALLGLVRRVPQSARVWLVLHGNGGQASRRGYVLQCLPSSDSVYVLEWPGYGQREGKPSRQSFNTAAEQAYAELRRLHPGATLAVLGESLGSGPASHLASLETPPEYIVLAVPFDTLASVASERMPWLPAGLLLLDRWDNIEALREYRGALTVVGAATDEVIPVQHARKLAKALPQAHYLEYPCGHNEWSHFLRIPALGEGRSEE